MAKRRLSEKNIDQLLVHYRNERRRLSYQLDLVRGAIADLKKEKEVVAAMPVPTSTSSADVPKRGPGRPRKDATVTASAGKPGRPKKRERKERALNEWDNIVIDAINSSGLLLPKEDILEHVKTWATKTNRNFPLRRWRPLLPGHYRS